MTSYTALFALLLLILRLDFAQEFENIFLRKSAM